MAITNLQQARQMYALGQLVSKTMDGSRPGYRGDDAYGGSAGTGGGNKGGQGPSARDRAMGLQGKTGKTDQSLDSGGPGVDRSRGFREVDRSPVGQFSTYGKNLMAKNLQSLAPNPLERGLELYNKYGLIPNAARVVGDIFGGIFGGSPKGFSTQGDPYGNAPGGLRDYSDPGPTNDRDGGDGNRNLYATTNQYIAPTFVEEDEEGITTMVNNPDFIQRFMVKEPYRQAKGLDFLAQNQAIANMINNLYT